MADLLARFRYRAVEQSTGKVRSGEIAGETPYSVRVQLRMAGYEVEHLERIVDHSWAPSFLKSWWLRRTCLARRPIRADLCDALASLLDAGLPLEQAVGSLSGSSARSRHERRMLQALRERLRAGSAMSEACHYFPDWFDLLDISMIDAGQAAGELPRILHDLGGFHQRSAALGHRLLMALAYPVVLLMASLAVGVFISRSTLPQLMTMLEDANVAVPWLTEALVATVAHLAWGWPLVLLFIFAGIWGVRRLLERIGPKSAVGLWLYSNPIARARTRARIAQLASVLARLLYSGVPLAEALEVAKVTVASKGLRQLLDDAAIAVRRGQDLSVTVASSVVVDAEFAQLLRVGEQTGELAEMLDRIAARYNRAAERAIERMEAVLEPAAIIILAVIIGMVVLAAVLPLVAMGDIL